MESFHKGYGSLFETGISEEGDGESGESGSFASTYGWIYNARSVAEHERVRLEDVFELSSTQFLNDLSYIKSLQAEEKRLRRNARVTE